ncbi:MAG: SCO6745 family protein [Streptosporangiaceae bacterium]
MLTETGRAEEAAVAEVAWSPRAMWTLFEPVHAVTYFAPEARSAFEEAGLRGFWRGYFAGRAAPLGAAGPEVVTASFYNFAPAMVERAIPAVWALVPPATAVRARQDGAIPALRRLLAGLEKETVVAAERLAQITAGLDCAGRVLAAANTALPQPDSALADGDGTLARLWHAATVLREHRGDGHSAALTAAGLDGCEVLVLRCALNMRREDLQPIRGWTDEQWDAAWTRLMERGLIRPDGEITAAGREEHAAVEEATDRAAGRPWQQVGADATAEIAQALLPLAQACGREVPYANPIGVPPPGPAAS